MTDPIQSSRRICEFFAEICRIPHPSFYCDGIRAFLKKTALTYNLEYRQDAVGNVRLDRKKSDHSQAVILQSHMDMVPQSDDPDFDFTTQSIEFEEINGVLRSKGCRTTLGADNGIGMAASLTALTDGDLSGMPLAALFTVDEETSMIGANNIDPEFLAGAALFNLDSEDWGEITIGCAGGCRFSSSIAVNQQDVPENFTGIKVRIAGLKGGHSGADIHLNRGNSILMMLEIISHAKIAVSELSGGNLSNAIPREAEFTGAVENFESLAKFIAEYKEKIIKTFDVDENFDIILEKLEKPPLQYISNSAYLAEYIRKCPCGVISMSDQYNCVGTSCNFAIINGNTNSIDMLFFARSIFNKDCQDLVDKFISYFGKLQATTVIKDTYPSWESSLSEDFLQETRKIFRNLFHSECDIKCIHAGLECGLFQSKNDKIPMLSFGPTIRNPHSPSEELEISTLKDFYKFLCAMIENVLKK